MGFLSEVRSSLENPQVPLSFPAEWLADIYNGGRTDSGIRVSQMTAIQLPAVYTCVSVVSNGIAAIPLNVMEVSSNDAGRTTRKLAASHWLHDVLHDRPHPDMSSKTWRQVMMIYALLWGNGYSEILYDGSGRVAALAPRAPWKTVAMRLRKSMTVETAGGGTRLAKPGELVYKTTQGVTDQDVVSDDSIREGFERIIAPENMIYVPGLTLDGRVGQDTVWLMRQCFGLALVTEKFGAKYFGNGGHPGGVLEFAGNMTTEQTTKAQQSFQEATGGENMHRVFVIKGGQAKFTPLGTPNDNAQFLETRKFQNQQIGALFQVPLHMLGEPGVNRATAEQLGQEFVNYTLGPWIPAFEQELKYKLFTLPNQRGRNSGRFEPKFDTRNLVYPDSASKSDFYQKGRLSGWLNTNMILELEGLNPISEEDGGEDFWRPVNVVVVGEEPEPAEPGDIQPLATEPPEPGEPPAKSEQKSAPDFSDQIVAALPLFKDGIGRYSHRKDATSEDFKKIFSPILEALSAGVFGAAIRDLGITSTPSLRMDKFLAGYIESMHKRSANFDAQQEAARATNELAAQIYKQLARA